MYKTTLNQLIHEELTISGEVQQEVLNVWKEIETCVPDIKTEDYTDYDYKSHNEVKYEGVKYGSYTKKVYIFNEKVTLFLNLYNFVSKQYYEKYKETINVFKASSVYQNKLRWLIITIPMISGTIIYKDFLKENLQHELEHLFQGKHGSNNIIIPNSEYTKALSLLGNEDKQVSDIALIIYLSNTSEQDAFVNGMYSYLMSQEEPMIQIKWSCVKNSDAYLHLMTVKNMITKLENADEELNSKCKKYFDLSCYEVLKIAKSVEFRFVRKIGKALSKYYKDIRDKYKIMESYSGKFKIKPNYFTF